MFALSVMELKLLLRKKLMAFSVVVVPAGLAALTVFGDRPQDTDAWAGLLLRNFLLLMMLSVYLVSLMVFTARRQALVLKRLRTSALSDHQILAGVLGPVPVAGLVLTVGYFVVCLLAGAPAPENPLVVALGVVLGVLVATALGVATACLSRSVEATQVTSVPVMLAGIGGLFLTASSSPALAAVGVAMPLTGAGDLVTRGWTGTGAVVGDVPVASLDVASSVLWVTVAGVMFSRLFHWDPRR